MLKQAALLVLCASLVGCVKERTFPAKGNTGGEPSDIVQGTLLINEFVASGSTNVNEFGTAEDWIEIFNPGLSDVVVEASRWFISDAGPSQPDKYALPAMTIPARGHIVVWCDNLNTVEQQIHSNFGLSSAGEDIVIFYDDGADGILVDERLYDPISTGGVSLGRSPDGGSTWTQFNTPTPGSPNQ